MPLTVVDGGMLSATNAQYTGFKNRIINGIMSVWQRGTTFVNPSVGGSFYTADRWGCNRAGDVTGATVSRSTSAPTGFQYSLALQRTAANTNTAGVYLFYSSESSYTYDLAGQTVTLSFWARAGANYSGGTLNTNAYSGTGTDQRVYAYTGSTTLVSYAPTLTTTWTQFSTTFTVPSNATEVGLQFYWTPTGTAGADDAVYITGVQLEKGSTATAFDYRPYGTELSLCQRYFEKSYDQATLPGAVSVLGNGAIAPSSALAGSTAGNITGGMIIPFKVSKRATPTIVTYDYDGTANAVRIQITTDAKKIGVTGIAGIQESGAFQFMTFSSASAVAIVQGAAVLFSWTASAEL
jgi:hypothetical protein